MQVQKADIIHDSLDEIPKHLTKMLDKSGDKDALSSEKMKVVNEEGKVLDVVYDPVLKCYYEPTQNTYYQVKDV